VSGIEVTRAICLDGTPHGFFGRRGGVSTGLLSGLNVSFSNGDHPDAAQENRRLATDNVLPGGRLATVHQIHSGTAVFVAEPWPLADRPHADALVTDVPGLVLGILTADCAPVLFSDNHAGVVAAAHAGWRGALAGVTDATIALMEERGARRERICAAVGPCIAQSSYEVDAAFRERFVEADADNGRFFDGDGARPHFDLEAYVRHRLLAAGVGEVEALHLDTYAEADRFFSFRRATHRGEPDYGRQLSAIALAD